MKTQLKIFILFAIALLGTFVPETFPEFFGDWKCNGSSYDWKTYTLTGDCKYKDQQHGPTTHWGFRHHIWFLCGVTLFIYNMVNILFNENEKTEQQ